MVNLFSGIGALNGCNHVGKRNFTFTYRHAQHRVIAVAGDLILEQYQGRTARADDDQISGKDETRVLVNEPEYAPNAQGRQVTLRDPLTSWRPTTLGTKKLPLLLLTGGV